MLWFYLIFLFSFSFLCFLLFILFVLYLWTSCSSLYSLKNFLLSFVNEFNVNSTSTQSGLNQPKQNQLTIYNVLVCASSYAIASSSIQIHCNFIDAKVHWNDVQLFKRINQCLCFLYTKHMLCSILSSI